MKKLFVLALTIAIFFIGCKKNDSLTPVPQEIIPTSKLILVDKDVATSALVSVDSTKLTFSSSASGVDKIKVGSVLVSDMTSVAPDGFLRKVTSISTVGGNKVLTTEQAALTDVIEKGNVKFSKTFTDSDIIGVDSSGVDISGDNKKDAMTFSFNFTYDKVVYDQDQDLKTTNDQLRLTGSMNIQPTFDFELNIDKSRVDKLLMKLSYVNTNIIRAEAKLSLASIKEEMVLKTFYLKPFTIPVIVLGVIIPVPIADQWIAIVLGIDGKISAKISAGAQNINTSTVGLIYENNIWNSINTQDNSFKILPLSFEGVAKIEPWIMARYEIRPYGLKASRIYLGARGSIISEAILSNAGLGSEVKWGVKFSAKAQVQIFDRAIIDYEKIFYEQEFPFYSKILAFSTLTTTGISKITQFSAQSGGSVSSDGGAEILARGVCWSTSPDPTVDNNKTNDGIGVGTFTSNLIGLNPNTTYYVRAYGTNAAGISYGDQISFKTSAQTQIPTLTTSSASSITSTSATCGGNVTSDGGATITSKGVCWSTSSNPTTSSSKTSDGTGAGTFNSSLIGLTPNTTYYVRAYAINSLGTAYGSQTSFTTSAPQLLIASLTTTAASAITTTSATSGGIISSDGGATVTSRGVCWSTSSNPTTANSKTTNGTGAGTFTSSLTALSPNTTYYVRAYAINSVGTAYGTQITFTTNSPQLQLPTLTTTAATSITTNSATSGGNITSDGGATVTARGVCWSTSTSSPTILNSKTTNGTGTGNFISSLTGLSSYTTYYVRAYATNSVGTAYGTQISFTTGQTTDIPSVTTASISSITQTTATGGGNVTSDGNLTVTARGVCWSTSSNPTTSNSKTTNSSGIGSFTSSITGLSPNTTYYVRAFATNSAGTGYGNQITFTTTSSGSVPTLTTTAASAIATTSATSGGNISSDGGVSVTARGVCWSTSSNPTTSNNKTTDGTGTGSFFSSITGLSSSTTYYVRSYATNSAGTAYGNQISITTTSNSGGTVTDIDGNVYNTVTIGTQVWMVENLKTTKYNDGTNIPNVTDNTAWAALTTGAYCWYNNDAGNKDVYGALYNWYTVNTGKLAPTGWHVASDAEWTILENYLIANGFNFDGTTSGNKYAKAMASTTNWTPSTGVGVPGNTDYPTYRNKSGFTAQPGSSREHDGNFYYIVGGYGDWWSCASGDYTNFWSRLIDTGGANAARGPNFQGRGLSVRCVRD